MIYSAEFVESLFWTLPEPFPGYGPVVDNYQESRPFERPVFRRKNKLPLIIDISDMHKISELFTLSSLRYTLRSAHLLSPTQK